MAKCDYTAIFWSIECDCEWDLLQLLTPLNQFLARVVPGNRKKTEVISEAKESFILWSKSREVGAVLWSPRSHNRLWVGPLYRDLVSGRGTEFLQGGCSYTAQVPDWNAGYRVFTGAGAHVLELRCKHSHVAPGTLVWSTGDPWHPLSKEN